MNKKRIDESVFFTIGVMVGLFVIYLATSLVQLEIVLTSWSKEGRLFYAIMLVMGFIASALSWLNNYYESKINDKYYG